jgi:hypothetical protein
MDFGDVLRMTPEQYDEYRREQRLYGTEALRRQHDAEVARADEQIRMQRMQEKYKDIFDTKVRKDALEHFQHFYRCTDTDIDTINAIYDEIEGQKAFDDAVGEGLKSVWG